MHTILIVGTYDTKAEELEFLADCIAVQGGHCLRMDVSVLGDPPCPVEIDKHAVAGAADSSIAAAIACDDENAAMQIMARGAALQTARLQAEGRIHGVIALGGTMGTDLALDVCATLPPGVPKMVVSTVSFSAMIPPERLAPDIQMMLWAGGLYGLNDICRASLSQAAGAVLGAARTVQRPGATRPLVGMTSFGGSILRYMHVLKPALAERGFDLAVFHATGMGSRAFEALAAQGAFCCVMDFATQEVGNHLMGSGISAGPERMTAAGLRGVPQMVAPACNDLVDFIGWQEVPPALQGRPVHAHNRLLSSAVLGAEERVSVAKALADKLRQATGPSVLFLPLQGTHEWDRHGAPLHDPAGLAAFNAALRAACPANVPLRALDCHINDPAFCEAVLAQFDAWLKDGTIRV